MAGRRLEDVMLAFAAEQARGRGARWLLGSILETERNRPIRGLFERPGFEALGEGRYRLDLEATTLAPPDVYAVAHA
jgi:predicted enzyme involved in methoxymalonyl-ACP biosynthesis